MKSNSTPYRLIRVDGRWYAAFLDKGYRDFVIEFSYSFATAEVAEEAVKDGAVYPNMPCRHWGK